MQTNILPPPDLMEEATPPELLPADPLNVDLRPPLRSLHGSYYYHVFNATASEEENYEYADTTVTLVILGVLLAHLVVLILICALLEQHCPRYDPGDGSTVATADDAKDDSSEPPGNDDEEQPVSKICIRRIQSRCSSNVAPES